MKKARYICLLITFIFSCPQLMAQYISDQKFREAIEDQCPDCINGFGILTNYADTLQVLHVSNDSIVDITGVVGFSTLTALYCDSNFVSAIPPLPASLKTFVCSDNMITILPASLPPGLRDLECEQNLLTSVPALPDSIETFLCGNNMISSLPAALPSHLHEFKCDQNDLTSIPALPDSLVSFFCSENLISVLPPSLPSQLDEFKCEKNNLTSLPPLPAKLTELFCSNNSITALPVLPPLLDNLTCNDNALGLLPALPASLTSLHCNLNHITKLPELPPSLEKLYCSQNSLSSLPELPASLTALDVSGNPISCFPFLPFNIQTLVYDFTYINCLPNLPYIFQILSPLPLCVGDSTSCALYPKVSGTAFIDYNANGIKDGIDVPAGGIKINSNLGNWVGYTDSVGKYEMSIGLNNPFTITPEVLPGTYNVVPASLTFNTSDTSDQRFANSNFAFQPAGDNYDIGVSLTPGISVPSKPTVYTIAYKNNSAFSINATIQLVFDQNLSFVGADVVPSTQVGFTLGWDVLLLPPFASRSINVLFNVSGSEVPGNILVNTATGTLTGHTDLVPSNNSQTVSNAVWSAAFSNYLSVSDDSISLDEIAAGKFLDYILYFQNTSSFTVNKLEVLDTLSSYLNASSFESVGTSDNSALEISNADFNPYHPVVLHWTLNNIHLPPANADSVLSRGSINFRIKVASNVALGTLIKNKANILFDYSSIPTTSSTSTLVYFPIGIANILNDETVHITPNPFSDLISISCDKTSSSPATITVYDLAGKKIREEFIDSRSSQKFSVDFSDLSSGAYLMTLKTSNGISSFKIFRQ